MSELETIAEEFIMGRNSVLEALKAAALLTK